MPKQHPAQTAAGLVRRWEDCLAPHDLPKWAEDAALTMRALVAQQAARSEEPGAIAADPVAHQQLARALRHCAAQISDMRDGLDDSDAAAYQHADRVLGNTHTLLRVLANVADGMPLLRAMGAPGDWGYGTPLGEALRAAQAQEGA